VIHDPISKGAGSLVAAIWIVSIVAGDPLAALLIGPNASRAIHNFTGEWLAAAITLAFAILLRTQTEIGVHPETKEEAVIHSSHSLFFIPVAVWSAIFFILGIVVWFRY